MSSPGALPTRVSDARANKPELVVHAAQAIGRSKQRRLVYEAVYWHKKRVKTVDEIVERTGLTRTRVLQLGNELVKQQIMGQTTKDGQTAYVQDPFYQQHKKEILRLVGQPAEIRRVPTKRNPSGNATARGGHARSDGRAEFIALDGIDSFARVRGVPPGPLASAISEDAFKLGVQRVLSEKGVFKDWGGEQNDLFTTTVVVRGRRRPTAFAFKGPGLRGRLRPKNMGANGDQVQRLFRSPAEVCLVQFHGQVDESLYELMQDLAGAQALKERKRIFYGVIDGRDSSRLIAAYPDAFTPPTEGEDDE